MARIFDEKGTMHMNSRYDVAILGCGEAGIFAGYELMLRNPGLKVVALDQGADIYSRSCPIVAGKVKSFIQSDGGAERVLNVYQAGSLFGEASFFDQLPRVSSAVALTPCELVPMDRGVVTQAVARDPELAMSMLQYLARTVRLLSEQLDDMAFRPVPWRLARFLLSGADRLSTVHSTQDEMAASISASRVTVSRTLNDFARRGWVELGYREVRLLRPEELRALCQT